MLRLDWTPTAASMLHITATDAKNATFSLQTHRYACLPDSCGRELEDSLLFFTVARFTLIQGAWTMSGSLYLALFPFFAATRSCRATVTTLSMSSQGAGFPVQISN